MADVVEIGESGYLFISAVGGKGGNGGRGGDGQPGAGGYRGRDATRYTHGTDGGPGGAGGNAGNPTDGARGGDGGQVSLEVGEQDQGLLMLVKGDLTGGDIGFAGEGGSRRTGRQGRPGRQQLPLDRNANVHRFAGKDDSIAPSSARIQAVGKAAEVATVQARRTVRTTAARASTDSCESSW